MFGTTYIFTDPTYETDSMVIVHEPVSVVGVLCTLQRADVVLQPTWDCSDFVGSNWE